MFDLNDLSNKNSLNYHGKKVGGNLGWKEGRVRGVFSATGGLATGTYNLVDALDGVTALNLPYGCTVTRVTYKVLTSFESGTDAATIALQIVAANDVVSALALSDGSNIWDAADKPLIAIPVTATLSTWLTVKTNGGVTMKAVVGVEALTQGKLLAFVEYLFWGDVAVT